MMAIYGKHRDGRAMRIVGKTTLFGNQKIVLEGMGENMLGCKGWAHIATFRGPNALDDCKKWANEFYGFREG